jgi:hypothetical protein
LARSARPRRNLANQAPFQGGLFMIAFLSQP